LLRLGFLLRGEVVRRVWLLHLISVSEGWGILAFQSISFFSYLCHQNLLSHSLISKIHTYEHFYRVFQKCPGDQVHLHFLALNLVPRSLKWTFFETGFILYTIWLRFMLEILWWFG
jgi:hypothetical protein